MRSKLLLLSSLLLALASAAIAESRHYALILPDAPVAERFITRERLRSGAALSYRREIQNRQQQLRAELAARRVLITGSADTLLNAILVTARADRIAELRGLGGVLAV